jgi:hypothetical protein
MNLDQRIHPRRHVIAAAAVAAGVTLVAGCSSSSGSSAPKSSVPAGRSVHPQTTSAATSQAPSGQFVAPQVTSVVDRGCTTDGAQYVHAFTAVLVGGSGWFYQGQRAPRATIKTFIENGLRSFTIGRNRCQASTKTPSSINRRRSGKHQPKQYTADVADAARWTLGC